MTVRLHARELLKAAHAGDFQAWDFLADVVEESTIGDLAKSLIAEYRRRADWYPRLLEMIRKAAHVPDRERFRDDISFGSDLGIAVVRYAAVSSISFGSIEVYITRTVYASQERCVYEVEHRLDLEHCQELPDPFNPLCVVKVNSRSWLYLSRRLNDICFSPLLWHPGCPHCDGTGYLPTFPERPVCGECFEWLKRMRELEELTVG